jgi:hypothetical protein
MDVFQRYKISLFQRGEEVNKMAIRRSSKPCPGSKIRSGGGGRGLGTGQGQGPIGNPVRSGRKGLGRGFGRGLGRGLRRY